MDSTVGVAELADAENAHDGKEERELDSEGSELLDHPLHSNGLDTTPHTPTNPATPATTSSEDFKDVELSVLDELTFGDTDNSEVGTDAPPTPILLSRTSTQSSERALELEIQEWSFCGIPTSAASEMRASARHPTKEQEAQLEELKALGFTDRTFNLVLLVTNHGDMEQVKAALRNFHKPGRPSA
jgi:hypothetical protein